MLAAPRRAIDPGSDQAARNRRAQQQLIDASPVFRANAFLKYFQKV
jgi:hypothetical protein